MKPNHNDTPPPTSRFRLTRAWKLGLAAGFSIQLLLILFVTAIGLTQMRDAQQRLQNIVDNDFQKLLHSKTMYFTARERLLTLFRIIESHDPFERDAEYMRFKSLATEFAHARLAMEQLPLTRVELELLELQSKGTVRSQPTLEQVADLAMAERLDEARSLLFTEAIPIQNGVLDTLAKLDKQTRWSAQAASRSAREEYVGARRWMLALSGAALLIGLLAAAIAFYFTQRAGRERELLATHDTLTGLPNRMLFMDRLEQALLRAKRQHSMVGIAFVDLDRFKVINDTLGHAAGDELIREVACRLKRSVRAEDVVARLGGDEFAMVITEAHKTDNILNVLEKLVASMTEPCRIADREIFTSCSIGVSVYPHDGLDAAQLLKNADSAMYHAKAAGRNCFQLYDTEMNALAEERLALETDLHYARERREFVFHYQPQLNVETGRIEGVEALLRWNHPRRGLLGPATFLDLLEETGGIIPVGQDLLTEACRQCAAWHAAGFPHLSIAVNLSGKEFWHAGLVDCIRASLDSTGLPPQALHLELTESIFILDVNSAVERILQLKALGVAVAIDDFGTGYSSLAHLKRFPLDVLKIDRYFVNDIHRTAINEALVGSILALCEGLHLDAVAEGVEERAQFDRLNQLGCRLMQGYLISRPVPAEALPELLSRDWRQHFSQSS